MRKLILKKMVDDATFEPKSRIYLDDVETDVYIRLDSFIESISWHGSDMIKEMPLIVVQELNDQGHNLTVVERALYVELITDMIMERLPE